MFCSSPPSEVIKVLKSYLLSVHSFHQSRSTSLSPISFFSHTTLTSDFPPQATEMVVARLVVQSRHFIAGFPSRYGLTSRHELGLGRCLTPFHHAGIEIIIADFYINIAVLPAFIMEIAAFMEFVFRNEPSWYSCYWLRGFYPCH